MVFIHRLSSALYPVSTLHLGLMPSAVQTLAHAYLDNNSIKDVKGSLKSLLMHFWGQLLLAST